MMPDDKGYGEERAAVAALGAVVGDELATTDLPRSPFYPTAAELAKLGRGVDAQLARGWRQWLEEIFSLAREARNAPDARSLPDVREHATTTRAALLEELERRRPGATLSQALTAMLADDGLLLALVDALAVLDEIGSTASTVEP